MFLFVFPMVAYQEYGIKKTLLIRFFIVRIAEVGISIFFAILHSFSSILHFQFDFFPK